jgi:dinuclear metal center YbgI/SA1388 family protein
MLVAELVAAVERLAPPALAEEWDNVGLLVGRHNQPVSRLLVALELRDDVLSEAAELGCDAVLTHHPPIFPSLAAVTDDTHAADLVLRAAESRVAIVAAHTNLDAAAGGLNDVMAGLLGLSATVPLRPDTADPSVGLGRVGKAPARFTLEKLLKRVGEAFPGAPRRFAGDPGAKVRTVACCTGSGASLLPDALAAGADAYVTSDLKYHDADRAPGLALIALPHAHVERVAMKLWSKLLERALAQGGVDVRFAVTDTDPWQTG